MNLKVLFFVFVFNALSWAQAVRVTLNVNTDLVDQTNINPVKTLENAAQDFLNNTKWTSSRDLNDAEISIEMLLTISSVNNNSYAASLQVQSGRLVYNTNYNSPLVNFFDESFGFTYQEFQPFYYDVNRYNNNLISVLSYYINLVIGMEMDSFSPLGGTPILNGLVLLLMQHKQAMHKAGKPIRGRMDDMILLMPYRRPLLTTLETLFIPITEMVWIS